LNEKYLSDALHFTMAIPMNDVIACGQYHTADDLTHVVIRDSVRERGFPINSRAKLTALFLTDIAGMI
jgi:hypothetical protein